ncbi:CpaF family protein [Syntrophaceticus schinkii]|jgi:pilus assembly protein CpaF|uniref:Type II secretion system protein E n=1 Tax=Syntrophaceticus schinkii TaxID=499207 RepID=A0A0B7MKB1_9FIRM|nr:ATPase, T2SS/T4P/T4SS family [Syntrophaceticus schinkii]CEO88376.1 Type II secretion system protein E [Syntrophaceticus schinkii]
MSLLKRLQKEGSISGETAVQSVPRDNTFWNLKFSLHQQVVEKLEQEISGETDKVSEEEREQAANQIKEIMAEHLLEKGISMSRNEQQRMLQELLDEVFELGPISPLLRDETVSEVMVNGPSQVYVERNGVLEETEVQFRDDAHVARVMEKIVSPLGRRIDESSPMVDARLSDGSRVNAVIPPLTLNGPTLTIRKFSKDPYKIDDLIRFGTLSGEMAKFIEACVKARLNIIVSGGTGSGKTTTLNVLSSFIPEGERIVTIEDAAEIQLHQRHWVRMESRPPNIEGRGAITIRDLVRNSLRMRPDRIVVGEVRSGEALDMLQAMNTGHDGSLTTGHANSPRDMMARLETMVLMAGVDLPVRAIREQISSALDLVVHQSRMQDGSRKVTHLTEVQGMEGDTIVMQDLFIFKQYGVEQHRVVGEFKSTGIRPRFMHKFADAGISLPDEIFY